MLFTLSHWFACLYADCTNLLGTLFIVSSTCICVYQLHLFHSVTFILLWWRGHTVSGHATAPICCFQCTPYSLRCSCHFPGDHCPLHRSNDDYLDEKRENYHVCSVQYCVQQLCTVQCTHIWTDLTVVCWLDLACVWLYCVLQCYSLSVLGLAFWNYYGRPA